MSVPVTLDELLRAVSAGGSTCLTSVTELAPAAGQHAAIAPAIFPPSKQNGSPQYAFERRYLDGELRWAVLVDGKASQLNRMEVEQQQAIDDGDALLSRVPQIVVTYERDGAIERYTDMMLPHRAFDGHFRAGNIDGVPTTDTEAYRALRNATPQNARALLESSPSTLVYGGWDSTRKQRQGRWPSAVVGEIMGFCHDNTPDGAGRARVDPVGMQVKLHPEKLKSLRDQQKSELSGNLIERIDKDAKKLKSGETMSASVLGLGGVPPTLGSLAGVACDRIIRSHVLSFAGLRRLRFGAGPEGDAACRALLAAFALDGLARADGELFLRANCHLREADRPHVTLDARGGEVRELTPLIPASTTELLGEALAHAESAAGVRWDGTTMQVTGNPEIVAMAADDPAEGEGVAS